MSAKDDAQMRRALRAMYDAAIDHIPLGRQSEARAAAEAIGMGIIHSDPPAKEPAP